MLEGQMDAGEVASLFDRRRLRLARELRGFSQVELAREAGSITGASLSQFENGHARPAAPTLKRLAVVLRVPISFFAAHSRDRAPEPAAGYFRSLRSTTTKDRQRALAHVQLVHDFISELEKYVALPDSDLSSIRQPVNGEAERNEIESIAASVREKWEVSPGPILSVSRLIERHGIPIARFRVGIDQVDAFSVPFSTRPIIALGADKNLRDRSRFDACHELGHLVMHDQEQIGRRGIEAQAHQFAAAFLMPEADIISELPSSAEWSEFLKLKAKWQVSMAALVMRARTLGVMDERTYTQAWKTLSVRGWRKREPGDLGLPEIPQLIRRAVDVAENSGVGFEFLVQQAGLPTPDVRSILEGYQDPRPKVDL